MLCIKVGFTPQPSLATASTLSVFLVKRLLQDMGDQIKVAITGCEKVHPPNFQTHIISTANCGLRWVRAASKKQSTYFKLLGYRFMIYLE